MYNTTDAGQLILAISGIIFLLLFALATIEYERNERNKK